MSDQYNNFDIYSKLTQFHVYDWDNPSDNLKTFGAGGMAYFNGMIEVRYSKDGYDPHFIGSNIHINAMELAHNSILTLEPNQNTDMNNLIHIAANYAEHNVFKYMTPEIMPYRTMAEFLQGRPRELIATQYYNLINIMKDKQKLNDMILTGTAPTGSNAYWSITGANEELYPMMQKAGVIPGSVCGIHSCRC